MLTVVKWLLLNEEFAICLHFFENDLVNAILMLESVIDTLSSESRRDIGKANVCSHWSVLHDEFLWLSLDLVSNVFRLLHGEIGNVGHSLHSVLLQAHPNLEAITSSSARKSLICDIVL